MSFFSFNVFFKSIYKTIIDTISDIINPVNPLSKNESIIISIVLIMEDLTEEEKTSFINPKPLRTPVIGPVKLYNIKNGNNTLIYVTPLFVLYSIFNITDGNRNTII